MIETARRPDGVSFRLVLFRHAEPNEEVRELCYGKLDVGLSERGRRQAKALARLASELDLQALYASPRLRARETASELECATGLEPVVDDRLSEMDFGLLEGTSYAEARRRYPEVYEVWMTRPTAVEFPEGESFSRMRARVREALVAIRERHSDATVGVVSHGGVNRIALADALALPKESLFRLGQSYGAINVIDYYSEVPVVGLVNGVLPC